MNKESFDTVKDRDAKNKTFKAYYAFGMILIVIFAGILVFDLVRFTNNEATLYELLLPSGYIFLGLAITNLRRKLKIAFVFIAFAFVLIITGLVAILHSSKWL
jgi:hypothetical protein